MAYKPPLTFDTVWSVTFDLGWAVMAAKGGETDTAA
jgi:hypothetical protein